MIITIIHFGSGYMQPELFETQQDLDKWKRAALHTNISKEKAVQVVKVEQSNDRLISYHHMTHTQFGERYKLSKQ